jgi:hypothetical protein
MTLIDTTNKLFEFFGENDMFDPEKDMYKIFASSENKDVDKGLTLQALEDLENLTIIKKIKYPKEEKYFWVLKQPLHYYEQTIKIDPTLALEIFTILNVFKQISDNDSLVCDVKNIQAKDIRNLVLLLSSVLEKESEATKEQGDEEDGE